MAYHKTSNSFQEQWNHNTPESGSYYQSRIQDIERDERAERAALQERTARLCAFQQARSNAVLGRLGLSIQQGTPPLPRPPASLRQSPESSVRGQRIKPIIGVPPLTAEDQVSSWNSGANPLWDEEDRHFKRKMRLNSQIARLTCELVKLEDEGRSPSPYSTSSSIDMHTPSELMSIPLLDSSVETRFTPTPPPPAPPNPVHHSSPQPPATPKRMTTAPKPPSAAAPTNRKGLRRGTNLRPAKIKDTGVVKRDLQPLSNASTSLSLCFKQFESQDWEKKMDGLRAVQCLARHHPELLKTKLHEVCLLVSEEVKNLHSTVARAAFETISELHVQFGKAMDPEAEITGRALLLKLAQTTKGVMHQEANLALDTLVVGCSPARVVSVLLNTGLSHRNVAVRTSVAQHLHQLADIMGAERILTAGKIFTERFLIAVSKTSLDASPEVRHYGQKMLQELARQKTFWDLWCKLIPDKDRRPLDKVMAKMRR